MELCELLACFAPNIVFHIGTEHGRGWIVVNATSEERSDYDCLLDRPVLGMFSHDGREECSTCCKLEKGFGITVAGDENGRY